MRKNRTVDNRPITLDGKELDGIGAHAVSVVEFELPEGYDTFTARGMISEGSGGDGRVEFVVNPEKHLKPERSAVSIDLSALGIYSAVSVRELWGRADIGIFKGSFIEELPLHGSGLYRVSPMAPGRSQ